MNTYYYIEGELYLTQEDAQKWRMRHGVISGVRSFSTHLNFQEAVKKFEELRSEGNSVVDSLSLVG